MSRFLLQQSGYEVDTAGEGREALDKARANPPDVLIADILMPGMDGFTLCRRWQADERLRSIPFVFYTATYTEPKDKAFALSLGAERFLMKPMEPDAFEAMLEEVIREAEAGHLVAPQEPVEEETVYLKEYNEALVRKLEEKNLELEEVNEALTREISERRRAEQALRRHAMRLETLRTIDQGILQAWSPEETAQTALRHLLGLIPSAAAAAGTFEAGRRELRLFAVQDGEQFAMEAGTSLPLDGVTGQLRALEEGGVFVEEDLQALPEPPPVIQAMVAAGVRSAVVGPVMARGELMGALVLGSDRPGAYTEEDADFVREVSEQLAVALREARLRSDLEAERQRLAATVDHMPEGVLLLDAEQRILLANPQARQVLARLTGAGIGDTLERLGDRPLEAFLDVSPGGQWNELDLDDRIFEIIARPAGGDEANVAGWVVVLNDVTELRQQQAQAHRQQRLAAVGQLAGGIAHDFRNFLSTIILYAEMTARHPDLPPKLVASMETIVGESRQASRLVQQILDFSRRSRMKTQPLDLQPFVEEAVHVLERSISERIAVLLDLEDGDCVVDADPTRVQQVLMNLALNARDAMPQGGELRISLERIPSLPDGVADGAEQALHAGDGHGDWVCLIVEDTGTGMTEEVRSHLFEPFFSTKEPGMGTGLGLAQVYGIVEQHGGFVDVETAVGVGSTFRVYLPAHDKSEPQSTEIDGDTVPCGESEVILLVEDEERVRVAVEGLLASLGYEVVTAVDGEGALALCERREPALVITDLVMPRMGGRALVQALRQGHPEIKTVVMTGYAVDDELEGLEELGVTEVVEKPFEVPVLAQAVRRALDA